MNYTHTYRALSCSLLLSMNAANLLFAQQHDIRFDHISVEQGLSNFSISDIVQDQQGFLWIATEEGLNRYDGYDFTVYKADPTDSTALPNFFIRQLYLDHAGNLWIDSGNQFYRYNHQSDSFDLFEHIFPNTRSLSGKLITRMLEDRNGDFWLGTTEGLYRYDRQREKLIHYRHDPNDSTSISGEIIVHMAEDRTGALWIGTSTGGVSRFDREKNIFKSYRHDPADPDGLSSDFIWSICEDRRGVIWIGTESGLSRYDRRTDRITRYRPTSETPRMIGSDRIFVLFEDSRGTLWAGTRNVGLWRYEPQTDGFFQYQYDPDNPYSLSGNRIHAIYEDRSGVLWFGHYRAGLSRYTRRQDRFGRYKITSEIYAICQDRNSKLWVGGSGTGLMEYNREGKLLARYRHDPQNLKSLSSDVVWAIYEDRLGNLWIGTKEGLNLFDSNRRRFIRYNHQPVDPKNDEHREVKTIYEDASCDLWVGTKGSGLIRWDQKKKSFVNFEHDPKNTQSLTGVSVWAVGEDQHGDLWIGTFGAGLYHFNRKTRSFFRYEYDPKQSDQTSYPVIYSLHVDSAGNVWSGTFGRGLQRFDPRTNRFTHYTDRNGLSDNFVKGILSDDHGNLWLSTDKGLSRFDPRAETFKNYNVQDGLISNVLLSGAYYKSKDGRLFFGGEGGVIAFHPDSLQEKSNPPPVVITDFKVFDKSLPPRVNPQPPGGNFSSFIRLSYSANFFSFEFVALDFIDPSKNQYAYRMEGFDQDWIDCGARRYAGYTNVDPGEYVFHVKAANSDGVWNENGASIKVIITPPFWKTWWFRALATAIIGTAAWGIYRYRVNHLLEMERLRTRIAADLHDEIAGNLSSIAMFGKIVQDEAASAGEKTSAKSQLLNRIIGLSQDSVDSIREIIWAIDPKTETIHDLLLRVHDLAVNACRAQNMLFKFDVPPKEQLPPKNLSPEQRKHLWLLLKEAITNAVKHSRATELSVSAHYKSGNLSIGIADNGAGINGADGSTRFSGKGMGTMKSRAEQLGGSFDILSSSRKGTTVTTVVKI